MATPPKTQDQARKVVVALLDGRRLKGYTFDFSPLKDVFKLLPVERTHQEPATNVLMKDLKAVFFVKDFDGQPTHKENLHADSQSHGRKIEVSFKDGEKLVGRTEGYSPDKPGFFMFPEDPESNNIRIFVASRNARQVRFV
jgi:hypothetical protein